MDGEIIHTFRSFEGGLNAGLAPLLLGQNVMAGATNTTVRGAYVHPRPPFQKLTLNAEAAAMIADAFKEGKYQGGGYFRPDNGFGSILASIAGRIFQFTPNTDGTATVTDRNPTDRNPVDRPQVWIWQAEKWAIVQDGQSNPLFIDGASITRSNYAVPIPYSTTTTALFAVPAPGSSVTTNFTDVTNLVVGDIVIVPLKGSMQVLELNNPNPNDVTLLNLNATPTGAGVAAATVISWVHLGTQLPPGRMGTYGLGRNWLALPDGRQFVASDIVGGASGTQANNYRDAVLSITENLFLVGGGNFAVPGSPGDIKAMIFTATLDVSLGQGPLQVFTPQTVFSCQAPVDRTVWQSVVNPILTESVITNGGLSQWATVNANSDILMRALDGIRSIKLSRRDFDTWGTTPISFEVSPQIEHDSQTTLQYSSAIVFDNRFLLTTEPKVGDAGIYWQGLIPLNFDPVSGIRGKAPSIYDSLVWTGLNVFQLFVGQFGGVERAFALCWNEISEKLEFYELLKSANLQKNPTAQVFDNGNTRIVWSVQTASGFQDPKNIKRRYKQIIDGVLHVQNLIGTVDFQVWWKPDQWPCFVPWIAWRECANPGEDGRLGFKPEMGLGEPPSPYTDPETGQKFFCDPANDRPLREGFTFQFMVIVTGQCEIVELSIKAVPAPDLEFPRPTCCPEKTLLQLARQRVQTPQTVYAILDTSDKAFEGTNDGAILQS